MTMELVIKVTAVCLVCALLAALLKKSNPELPVLLALAACTIILTVIISGMEHIHAFLNEIITWSGLPAEIFSPLWKTLGIALITKIGAELCKDAEEKTMAAVVETAGAFGAVMVAIPLFQAVWQMLQSLI